MNTEPLAPVLVFQDPINYTTQSIWLSQTDVKIARRISQHFISPIFQAVTKDPARPVIFHSERGTTLTLRKYAYNQLESRLRRPEWSVDLVVRGARITGGMVGASIRALKFLVANAVAGAAVVPLSQGYGIHVMLPVGMDPAQFLAALLSLEKRVDWTRTIQESATADETERQRIEAAARRSPYAKGTA